MVGKHGMQSLGADGETRPTLCCHLHLLLYPLYSTRRRYSCARRPPRVGTNLAKPDTLQEWF